MASKHSHLLLTVALIGTLPLHGQDKKISRAQLPSAVAQTADKETQHATVKGYATEREHGKTFYEVETMVSGHTRDLQIDSSGMLTEVEEEVSMGSLSPAVQSAIKAKAMSAQIVKVESLTKGGKLVAYEASTVKNGKKGEVQVGATGETLKHEE
jgi:uncharacterized membrane protein YkoI